MLYVSDNHEVFNNDFNGSVCGVVVGVCQRNRQHVLLEHSTAFLWLKIANRDGNDMQGAI